MIEELDDITNVGPAIIASKLNEVIRAHNKINESEKNTRYITNGPCQVCGGKLEFYTSKSWFWGLCSCYRCIECGRKWTDDTGPN